MTGDDGWEAVPESLAPPVRAAANKPAAAHSAGVAAATEDMIPCERYVYIYIHYMNHFDMFLCLLSFFYLLFFHSIPFRHLCFRFWRVFFLLTNSLLCIDALSHLPFLHIWTTPAFVDLTTNLSPPLVLDV